MTEQTGQSHWNTQGCGAIGRLLGGGILGAALGAVLAPVVGAICGLLYAFVSSVGICVIAPPVWLLAVIWGTVGAVPWMPLGAIIGTAIAIYRLYQAKRISKTALYSAGAVVITGLALLAVCWVSSHFDSEKTSIATQYIEIRESYNRREYERAYSYMSPAYRQVHSLEDFKSGFGSRVSEYGNDLHPNHSIKLSGNKACLYPLNQWPMGLLWGGPEFELEYSEGVWFFTGRYNWYIDGHRNGRQDICPSE